MSRTSTACAVCEQNSGERPVPGGVVFENALWMVFAAPRNGVAGWMMLHARRHVPGPAHFSDVEAASFGPTLRHLELALEGITGALRVYTAAMGESFPHFHCHMVPRYRDMPNEASGWSVFDLPRLAAEGAIPVDPIESLRVADAFKERLRTDPPPSV